MSSDAERFLAHCRRMEHAARTGGPVRVTGKDALGRPALVTIRPPVEHADTWAMLAAGAQDVLDDTRAVLAAAADLAARTPTADDVPLL